MPRHTTLFAAALAALSVNVAAQTGSSAPADGAQASPPPGPQKTCARPVYPVEAIRNEWTGVVTIAFLIGSDGLVQRTRVLKSSGHDILDSAAVEALSQCQFKPAMTDGKPVAAWRPVQFVWTLDADPASRNPAAPPAAGRQAAAQ